MADGDMSLAEAARRLDITWLALTRKIAKLGITPGRLGSSRVLNSEQFAIVQADTAAEKESLSIKTAARRLKMSRFTLGRRMNDLGIQSRRVGQIKLITPSQFAAIEAHDRASRRRPAKEGRKYTRKLDGI